ncbi:MAG: hypothetical protein ACR2N7_06405 [Acidimicrobiia bacterium]
MRKSLWTFAAALTLVAQMATPVAAGVVDDNVGLVDPTSGEWHIENLDGSIVSFYFGNPGDTPFSGDWDCDGVATPGLFRTTDAFAYLRNSNSQGIADVRFYFGNPSDVPLAGDFNGDGCDTLSIYRPMNQTFYIMNNLGENEGGLGAADYSFVFGNPGDKPVVGDWDGDGIDEIGLHRESTGYFYWRDTLDSGIADGEMFFGDPGDRFVAGDWGIVDGMDSAAVYRPATETFYFRYTLTQGNADKTSMWGDPSWLPVAGPMGTVSVPNGSETIDEFVAAFEAANRSSDGDWLYSRIHPQALQVLGADACRAYFTSHFAGDPDYQLEATGSTGPSLWEMSGYGPTLRIANTYTLTSAETWGGITAPIEWHASMVGSELRFFPSTCDLPSPPICLDSIYHDPPYLDVYVDDFLSPTESTVLWLNSTDGSCSGSITNTERGVVVAPTEPQALTICRAFTGNPNAYTYNLRGAGFLDAPPDWYLCGPD